MDVFFFVFVCVYVEILRPSQPNGLMSRVVGLPNHSFTGQAYTSKQLTFIHQKRKGENDHRKYFMFHLYKMHVAGLGFELAIPGSAVRHTTDCVMKLVPFKNRSYKKKRNSRNGYIVTSGSVQEMELNAQNKHCSAKHEKVKVSNN